MRALSHMAVLRGIQTNEQLNHENHRPRLSVT